MTRFAALGLLLAATLAGCSRYTLIAPNAESEQGLLRFRIADNFGNVSAKVQGWLTARHRLERTVRPASDSFKIHFVTRWVRDSSLRYYMLEYDRRVRHLSEWKSQWTVKAAGNGESTVEVRVLEVLFVGEPKDAGPLPAIDANTRFNKAASDWFETDADKLRAEVEARRFLNESYPLLPLPKELAALTVPSLDGLPSSKEFLKPKWLPLQRPRSF